MTGASRKIPPQAWEQHKTSILKLRFKDGLPLDGTKSAMRGVMQLMQEEHGFQATVWQYESQLKKWGAAKNLKKRDWEKILPVYDRLKAQGLEPRVRLGDEIFKEPRVKRARRYVEEGSRADNDVAGPTQSPTEPRLWQIEVCQGIHGYTEYTIERGMPDQQDRAPAPDAASPHDDSVQPSISPDATCAMPSNEIALRKSTPPPLTHEDTEVSFSSMLTPDTSFDFSFDFLDEMDPPSTVRNRSCSPSKEISSISWNPQWVPPMPWLERLVLTVSKGVGFELTPNMGSLSLDRIIDSLDSLLQMNASDDASEGGFSLLCRGAISDSEIHRRIIFAIVNNFAGLEHIPSSTLLGILKVDAQVTSRLWDSLQSNDLTIAKPLADNLFSAAVEAGDAQAVESILSRTAGRPNRIDVDLLRIRSLGSSFVPLTLACFTKNFAIVLTLLSHGADPDARDGNYSNALDNALFRHEVKPGEDMQLDAINQETAMAQIVKLLLSRGARVYKAHIQKCISAFQDSTEVLHILIDALLQEDHRELFTEREWDNKDWPAIRHLVQFLDAEALYSLIQRIVDTCKAEGCAPACIHEYQSFFQEALAKAVLTDNVKLRGYLLQLIKPSIGSLTAAIHLKRYDLIGLFLEYSDLNLDDAVCSEHMSLSTSLCDGNIRRWDGCSGHPTSPLAEALVLQDSHLVRCLEDSGHLERIPDMGSGHFEAVATAAAKIGDLTYFSQIVKIAPISGLYELGQILLMAMRCRNFEIAKEIVVLAADAFGKDRDFGHTAACDAFRIALEEERYDVVDTVLEFHGQNLSCRVLSDAVQWGTISLVEDLLQMDFTDRFDGYQERPPLEVAVEKGDMELVSLLLRWGFHRGGLLQAVKTGNADMVGLLLSQGVDPADEDAILFALNNVDGLVWSMIAEAFQSKYPKGKKGFGQDLLRTAALSPDAHVFRALLQIKPDINGCDYDYDDGCGFHRLIRDLKGTEQEVCAKIDALVHAGADLEVARRGKTALLVAIESHQIHLVEPLLASGAKVNRPARRGLKRTPLQQACEAGSFRMVQLLLDHGADLNAPAAVDGGATALQLAAIQGSVRIVNLLLQRGADIHAAAAVLNGRTALEGAAEHGRISVLNVLLAKGGEGYKVEEIKRARKFAENENHRGCEDRLTRALFRFGVGKAPRASLGL